MQDLRYALRTLWKARAFATLAVVTLAIGIGANTAIFTMVDAVLLRPLGFRQPGQLLRLFETEAAPGTYPFAGPDLADWRIQNHTFQDMATYGWPGDMSLSTGGHAEEVKGIQTETNFFDVLGAHPLIGRTWAKDESQDGKNHVVLLSYGLWKDHFASDPGVVGRTMDLSARKYTIIGIMPPSFRFPPRAQLWVPREMVKNEYPRGSHWANAIGRLKPGVSVIAAQADLTVIAAGLEKAYPDSNYKVGASVVPLAENLVGNSRRSLLLMMWAVGLVLLIACANVANLLLSRAVARQKEMAVRSALGAGRARLVRQLLTESVVLATAGAALGLLFGYGIVSVCSRMQGFAIPQFNLIELNGTIVAFVVALAVSTGILFGIAPALQASRSDLNEELKGGSGSVVSASRGRRRASNVLVVGEIGLSLLLLASAGLFLKDFMALRRTDVGVRDEGVWTGALQLPDARYESGAAQSAFARSLLEKAKALPGVDSVALTDHLPLEGGSNGYVKLHGRPTAPNSGPLVETHSVTSDYFRTLGIRLIAGRVFSAADEQQSAELDSRRSHGRKLPPEETNAMVYPSVINRAMANHFWPNQNPVGQMFSRGSDVGPWHQVIGIVSDVREWDITHEAVPEAYNAFTGNSRIFLVLHGSVRPSTLSTAARRIVSELDPALPLFNIRTMDEVVADQTRTSQFLSLLVGLFAIFAAVLAAVGIYGVLSYAVEQRTREIGIRMSLGATQGGVLKQILLEGMRLAIVGSVIGIAAAFAAARAIASQLHDVKPTDPVVLTVTTLLLVLVALAACLIPARRAARLDPMRALRQE